MIVEKLDLAAVRLCEQRGMFPSAAELARAGLEPAEYRTRLKRLAAAGVICSYRAILVVPPLLGGDWVWAGVLASAKRPLGVGNALTRRLPFVTEIVLNQGLPEGLGPNLALMFYSRDFETESQFIRSAPGIEYQEVYRVAEYSFPVAIPLSGDERTLLKQIVKSPADDIPALSKVLDRTPSWVQAKLDRLCWTESNRSGVIRVQPEVDWTRVENFGHFHLLVETGHRSEDIARLAAEHGFTLCLQGRAFRGRYVQVEADAWGITDLMLRVSALEQVPGIRVAGVVWNQRVSVNSSWVPKLLD